MTLIGTTSARRERGGPLSSVPPRKNGGPLSSVQCDEKGGRLSSAPSHENRDHLSSVNRAGLRSFATAEAQRERHTVPIGIAMRLAGFKWETYTRAVKALADTSMSLRASTGQRWSRAVRAAIAGNGESRVAVIYRLIVGAIARETGGDPLAVLATDFSRQRSHDPAWAAAAQVRRLAVALMVTEAGIERVALGQALSLTREAVRQAIAWVEDARERDPALRALVAKVSLLMTGQEAI